jgi:hypothetical protein
MSRDRFDYSHADTGTKPTSALNFETNERPNSQYFDWWWYTLIQSINGHADEFDRLDSDGDGVVDAADGATDVLEKGTTKLQHPTELNFAGDINVTDDGSGRATMSVNTHSRYTDSEAQNAASNIIPNQTDEEVRSGTETSSGDSATASNVSGSSTTLNTSVTDASTDEIVLEHTSSNRGDDQWGLVASVVVDGTTEAIFSPDFTGSYTDVDWRETYMVTADTYDINVNWEFDTSNVSSSTTDFDVYQTHYVLDVAPHAHGITQN